MIMDDKFDDMEINEIAVIYRNLEMNQKRSLM